MPVTLLMRSPIPAVDQVVVAAAVDPLGSGNDAVDGGAGDDTMFGGTGDDLFTSSGGGDVVMDFTDGDLAADHGHARGVALASASDVAEYAIDLADGGTLIDFGQGDRIPLKGVSCDDIAADPEKFFTIV